MSQRFRLGIFESVFARATLQDCFKDLAVAGFASVQFDLASADIDVWSESIKSSDIQDVVAAAQKARVSIPAVSGTYNMAHPDPAERADGLSGFRRVVESAPKLGATYVTLCTGSRSVESMWKEHADNTSQEAWSDSRASIVAALELADTYAITLLVEPEPANVVGNAVLARRMLDEVDHPRLKIVLDPANVVLSNRDASPSDVLGEAFDLLGPDIKFAHAKDLSATGEFCAAGTGIVPWQHYRSLLEGNDYQGDVIFHTLTVADVPKALEAWSAE